MKKLTILTVTLLLTALAQLTVQPVQAEVSIPDGNLAAAIRETLGLPTDAVITADAMRNLTRLDARSKGITDLTGLEHAVNLTALDLGVVWDDNEVHTNPISDVSPLARLTQLTWLILSNTAVSDVSPLANLTQLTTLVLYNTGVWDVSPLANLTQLTWLYLYNTGVSDVSPLANLTQLTSLHLGGTAVSDVSPLANLTQLTSLDLYNTGVSDVSPLANLTQLTSLDLGNTAVSDVSPLAALTQLTQLYLNNTAVSDVSPLAGLTQLTELSLNNTAVSDVSALANLTQLTYLSLSRTAVSDVSALANLTQLTSLSLSRTAVSDISPLTALTQLVELNLSDCPLNADAYQTHIPTIQANRTEVTFSPFKPIHLQQVPWLVSLIYFRPSDRPVRPNVDAEIDGLIKKAQRFFADQLELHGFGRKTFQFETDAHGNAVVHHVNGKFPNAHYQNSSLPYPWVDEIREQIYIPARSITVHMLDSDPDGTSFTGIAGTGGGGNFGGSVDIDNWYWKTIAHELAHACGLKHDWRTDAKAKRIKTFTPDPMLTSFCAAEWLSVHPAFNPGQPVSTSNATIKMLPPTLASPPNTIRLRFEVTDLDGLHQAQLLIPDFVRFSGQYSRLIDCQRLTGVHDTVEFVTTKLTPQIKTITLSVIDARGHMSRNSFDIDVASLIPPAKVVSIPDPNLAAAVRDRLNLSSSEPITTHSILSLVELEVPNRGIKDLTGLEHAVNLTEVNLGGEYISPSGSEGYLNSNAISDFSPLEKLTNLEELDLAGMSGLRDVSALARLTNLKTLHLWGSDVSDVSALAHLTNLKRLSLGPDVSDVSALAHLTNLERLGIDSTGFSDVSALASLTNLERLSLHGTGFSDVSALANLTNLKTLRLDSTDVSDVSALASLTNLERLEIEHTDVSDVSALASLTNLTWLEIEHTTGVSDVSALASLTNLDTLHLYGTGVSDVSPLLGMSQLRWVDLRNCPLSYASIHTHIPALQAKGIEVEFYNVARPALLKVSGDRQEGEPGAMLKTAFVVEAMDEHGKPIVGQTVRFSVLEGDGTLSAKTVKTDTRGKARVTLTLGWYPGVNKVKASSEGIQSWVLFTAAATEEAPQPVADVNGDGSVNIQDLVLVSRQLGKTGENSADVNGDGVVNIQDLVLVAAAFGEGAAAPSARAVSLSRLTASDVEAWLSEARGSIRSSPDLPKLQRGIAVLEQLLASLIPKATALLANYPNPFNPETWIPYQLANPAEVTVTIYAANGAVVRTLDFGHQRAGSYASRSRAAYWDGRNAQGEPVASGVYFYTLQAGDFTATKKMVIRK